MLTAHCTYMLVCPTDVTERNIVLFSQKRACVVVALPIKHKDGAQQRLRTRYICTYSTVTRVHGTATTVHVQWTGHGTYIRTYVQYCNTERQQQYMCNGQDTVRTYVQYCNTEQQQQCMCNGQDTAHMYVCIVLRQQQQQYMCNGQDTVRTYVYTIL